MLHVMNKIQVEKKASFTGHKDSIYSLEKGITEGEFYTSGADGMVVRWNTAMPDQGELVAQLPSSVYAMHCLLEHGILLIGQNFEGIHAIDLTTRKEVKSLKITEAALFDLKAVGPYLVAAAGDGSVLQLNQKTLAVQKAVRYSEKSARCITYDAASQTLAIGYSDHSIRILDVESLQVIHTIQGHANSVFSLAFSPDGRYLVSGSRDAHIKVWHNATGYKEHTSIVAHMYAINHIAYRQDGKYFATCSMDKSVKVWDAKTFSLLKVIDKARHAGHGTSVNRLCWIGEEEIVSCSDDRAASLWQISFN
jgi:WD40 repeat protein